MRCECTSLLLFNKTRIRQRPAFPGAQWKKRYGCLLRMKRLSMRLNWDLLEADRPYHSEGGSLCEPDCPDVPPSATTFSCSTGLPGMPLGQYSGWELWSGGDTVKASWARWSRAESQTQQPQVTLGFGVQKSWTHQENTNEQLSKVSLLWGIFQVSRSASLWRPLLCSVTHEDLFTAIFFLTPLSFYNMQNGDKERRPPFYRRLKDLEDDPSSKNQMSSAFTQSSLGQPFSYRTTDRSA